MQAKSKLEYGVHRQLELSIIHTIVSLVHILWNVRGSFLTVSTHEENWGELEEHCTRTAHVVHMSWHHVFHEGAYLQVRPSPSFCGMLQSASKVCCKVIIAMQVAECFAFQTLPLSSEGHSPREDANLRWKWPGGRVRWADAASYFWALCEPCCQDPCLHPLTSEISHLSQPSRMNKMVICLVFSNT